MRADQRPISSTSRFASEPMAAILLASTTWLFESLNALD